MRVPPDNFRTTGDMTMPEAIDSSITENVSDELLELLDLALKLSDTRGFYLVTAHIQWDRGLLKGENGMSLN